MKHYTFRDTALLQRSISDRLQETALHGDSRFPCASYLDHYHSGCQGYPWHWHDELEIAYVTEGHLTALVNEQKILLSPGEGIFFNRRVLHSFAVLPGEEAALPNILFLPSLLYGTQESVYWETYIKPFVFSADLPYMVLKPAHTWQADALALASNAFFVLTEEAWGFEFRARSLLSEFLLLLIQNSAEGRPDAPVRQPEQERVRAMLTFVQLHYTEPLDIRQIADSALISRRECMRAFRSSIGTSPIQYVIDLRIRKAKQLLVETDLTLLEIASACGFQSQSYFTKVFRERAGLPPAKFRRQARGFASPL